MSTKRFTWLLVVVSALFLAVGAASCGGDDDGGGGGDTIKVGLVTDTGGVDDRGFNQFSIAGLDKAESELEIEKRVYVSNSADDYEPNLQAAVDDGNEFVIAVGFLLAPSTIKVAKANPDVSFAGVDHFYGEPGDASCEESKTCAVENALGMQYPSEESGYLAGVIAALMTKSGTVSTVGGIKIPPVDNWIAGYQAAVKATKPSVKTLNAYSNDFNDAAKCKEIALDQISQGADVVFQVAGDCGLGAIDAACEKNAIAIGVDADQSAQGDCVLVSALKPLTESVFGVIQTYVDGEFKGGTNQFYGVEQLPDAQLLTDFQSEVPQSVKDAVAKAEKGLKDGTIDPPATLK
ncbi:MAG TPA: BMP family ABC transporter substrate-binding protein [Gaiellaceae bacterium]|nr:BMP family ABC transporter substrate-binding protein [Gaiellaceae bacterium]